MYNRKLTLSQKIGAVGALIAIPFSGLGGCSDTIHGDNHNHFYGADAGVVEIYGDADTGSDMGPDAGDDPETGVDLEAEMSDMYGVDAADVGPDAGDDPETGVDLEAEMSDMYGVDADTGAETGPDMDPDADVSGDVTEDPLSDMVETSEDISGDSGSDASVDLEAEMGDMYGVDADTDEEVDASITLENLNQIPDYLSQITVYAFTEMSHYVAQELGFENVQPLGTPVDDLALRLVIRPEYTDDSPIGDCASETPFAGYVVSLDGKEVLIQTCDPDGPGVDALVALVSGGLSGTYCSDTGDGPSCE